MHCWSKFILVAHHRVKLVIGDPLVGIFVQPAHNGNHIGLTGVEVIPATEIHDIAEVKEALSSTVNALEGAQVCPIEAAPQAVLDALRVNVILDLELDQIGDLSLYLTSKVLMGWAIVVGPLCDHRAHVKVVAREQDFHPSVKAADSVNIIILRSKKKGNQNAIRRVYA